VIVTATDRARSASSARAFLAETLRAQLADAGSIAFDAMGSSMAPSVPGGSVMHVEPLASPPAVGELLAFVPESGALLCCHRVIALDSRGRALTQGDAHAMPDGYCEPICFVGRVRTFTLGGRTYDAAAQQRPSTYRVARARFGRAIARARARIAQPLAS
jgi:hypothetical protein